PISKTGCAATVLPCVASTLMTQLAAALPVDTVKCVIAGLTPGGASSTDSNDAGVSVSDCTATSCAGCCRNGVCVSDAKDSACGSGGAVCTACDATQTCVKGHCQSSCNPANCQGCCDDKGQCQAGQTTAACGAAAGACVA